MLSKPCCNHLNRFKGHFDRVLIRQHERRHSWVGMDGEQIHDPGEKLPVINESQFDYSLSE